MSNSKLKKIIILIAGLVLFIFLGMIDSDVTTLIRNMGD